jgi:hypothetical protein
VTHAARTVATLFLPGCLHHRAEERAIAASARVDPDASGDLIVTVLDEPGGLERVLRIFGTPDAVRALAEALDAVADLAELTQLEGAAVDYVARFDPPGDDPSDE